MVASVPGGPVITGPASAIGKVGQAVPLPCKVTDPHWPLGGTITCQVSVGVGTLAASINGKPVSGSGSASLVFSDTVANVQAALATLSYTA